MTTLLESLDDALERYKELLDREPDLSLATLVNEASNEEDEKIAKVKIPKGSTEAIIRPNGEAYLPRTLTAHKTTDVAFMQVAYDNRMPVLLYGPPGTGKTALLEAALPNLTTLVGSAETEVSDFVGSWVQRTDGNYEWVDGPLVVAAENGYPFFIDEVALIDPRAMTSAVYPVMDGRDEIRVTANPARGTIVVKEGFCVYAACNPNVPGAIMSDALLSRFQVHVHVETDWDLARRLGAGTKIITAARNLEAKHKGSEVVAPPQLREVLTFMRVATTYGEEIALANLLAQARIEDRATFESVLTATFGNKVKPLTF